MYNNALALDQYKSMALAYWKKNRRRVIRNLAAILVLVIFILSIGIIQEPGANAAISGYVFLDENSNGEFDENEMGLPGYIIEVISPE